MRTTITITIDNANCTAEEKAEATAYLTPEAITKPGYGGRTALFNMVDAGHAEIAVTHTRGWIAGWNVPGYLPDVETMTFDSWQRAAAMLVDELTRAKFERLDALNNDIQRADPAFDVEERKILDTYDPALNALQGKSVGVSHGAKPEPFWVQCGRHVWWVAEEQ